MTSRTIRTRRSLYSWGEPEGAFTPEGESVGAFAPKLTRGKRNRVALTRGKHNRVCVCVCREGGVCGKSAWEREPHFGRGDHMAGPRHTPLLPLDWGVSFS